MKLEIHPEAAKEFNERADSIFERLQKSAIEPATPGEYPEFVVKHSITSDDIIGPIHASQTSIEGEELSWQFLQDGFAYGFDGESYRALVQVAEGIQRIKALRDVLSVSYGVTKLKEWAEARVLGRTPGPFVEYLLGALEQDIRDYEVWFPLRGMAIQGAIDFGAAEITSVSAQTLDKWFSEIAEKPEPVRSRLIEFSNEERERLQGYGCVRTLVRAEHRRAVELGIARAELATAFLRMMSPGVMFARVATECSIYSGGPREAFRHYLTVDGALKKSGGESLSRPWLISAQQLETVKRTLAPFGELLKRKPPSKFDEVLIRSIAHHSQAALTMVPEQKLVYVCSALDALFLRNETEPITQNIADRIANLVGTDPKDRQLKASMVKKGLGLRGGFVHHLLTLEETETCRDFLRIALAAVIKAVERSSEFGTKEAFIDWLDGAKYKGGISEG